MTPGTTRDDAASPQGSISTPDATGLPDSPLIIEDLLSQADVLHARGGDPVEVGDLWATATDMLSGG